MLVMIVIVGLLVLAGIAIVIGVAESRGLEEAWRRVRRAREEIHQRARELEAWEATLVRRAEELRRRERRLGRGGDDESP